jgi:hypothetical protein
VSYIRRIWGFWYDFLVDGRPELLIGPIVALAVVWGMLALGITPLLAGVVLVALVIFVTALSLALALRPRVE